MQQRIKAFNNRVPSNIRFLVTIYSFALLLLTLSRVVFYLSYSSLFSDVGFGEWLSGLWFDMVTLALLLLPFIVLILLPFNIHTNRWFRLFSSLLYFIPVLGILAVNFLDVGYFSFTHKRSTSDLFAIVSAGNDIGQLLGSFLRDFWSLLLLFAACFVFLANRYFKWNKRIVSNDNQLLKGIILYVVLIPFFILIGRGGFILKPLASIDATLFTEPQNTALVLNTGFTILKSIGKSDLELPGYFKEKELAALFQAEHQSQPQNLLPGKPNVVVIMLESFGNEWVGRFNGGNSYTPFLDSLLDESWYFEYGFSNGKKSIEAVPTIVASIPTLMDNPFISSNYGNNQIQALPSVLKEAGYSTAFYHGATNGSMRFNSFSKQAGFDSYVGRFEYNNDAHFDKTWGILDEYFNPWSAKQMSKQGEPFMATLFTLSSHHPYFIPEKWRKKLKSGPDPICKSIHYGDVSLKMFFEQAKKEKWYNNTVFVLVADHTPATSSNVYGQRTEMYKIPIAFYSPGGKLPKRREKTIFQQMDIYPTLIDLCNVRTNYFSFGHSYFSKEPREAVAYLEGTYYYSYDKYMLVYSNNEVVNLFDITKRTANPKDVLVEKKALAAKMKKRLQAMIQTYAQDLIYNKMVVK